MEAQLVGVRKVSFKNDAGETIKGLTLYVNRTDENVEGYIAEKVFVRDTIALPKDIKLSDKIEISCNTRGKIEKIFKLN